MEDVVRYYNEFNEWGWLETLEGRIEFERTLRLIDRHIDTTCRVLDLGGGPGRYTLALAARGHNCQLVDISPKLVNSAKDRFVQSGQLANIPSPFVGSATDLSVFKDSSFDFILALGPFYYLTEKADREHKDG